jgi:hypothetical protein
MRLMVDGGSYVAAATAFRSGNQLSALQHDALAGRLAAYGGMAGNDATSLDFARSYDTAAAEALRTLADVSSAFIALGRLTRVSEHHHRRAEDAAAAQFAVSAYTGGDLHEDDYVRVSPTTPPTSLGAQEPGLGHVESWILDRIEGFVWPGADTDRLHAAATTWRRAAEGVTDLLDHCDRAVDGLAAQRSPEIPLALDAVDELRSAIHETASQLATLAGACEEYAAHVEEARARTRALLAEIAQMVVEGMVVSAAVGLITGGTATGAVAGATVARVVAQAPRFRAILEALRAGATAVAGRVRATHEGALVVRARLEKFLHLELRSERGAISLPGRGFIAPTRLPKGPVSLRHHDELGGHAFARHVEKPDSYLRHRIEEGAQRASTFRNEMEANSATGDLIRLRGSAVEEWLASRRRQLVVRGDLGRVTGLSMDSAGRLEEVTGVRVILRRYEEGWRVHTAYPEPV